jgi:hypothetical protein
MLLTGGGSIEGKRLLSEASFRELFRPHIPINDRWSYGLGWVLYDWNGHRVVEHNGGSQGISAITSFIPDRHVGFVFMGNTSPNYMTAIGNAGRLLWPIILGEKSIEAENSEAQPAAAEQHASPTREPSAKPLPSPAELIARMIQAYGGEKTLRRHRSMEIRARKAYENQGVDADVAIRVAEPGLRTEEEIWTAAGTQIARVRTYVDGDHGGQATTFGQDAPFAGAELATTRRKAVIHEVLDLARLYKEIKVDGKSSVKDESAYLLRLTPEVGKPSVLYVSARTGLILRRDEGAETSTFGDFRRVDGEIVPHRTTVEEALGTVTIEVKQVCFGVEFPPETFRAITTLQ